MRQRRLSRGARVLLAAAASLALVPSASAINIILSYAAATSVPPASDPGGAQLTAIMQYIEGFYEDVFEDAHTITLTYRWGSTNPGILAAHTLSSQGGIPNRETAGTIVFGNTVTWFYDASPGDNSEYNMAQTLWRDLTATQQSDLYNNFGANIPSTFEAGFTGTGNGSNANVAGRTDLLSVAFHEVGHSLGMSAANTATQAQTADSDYDFNTAFVFGQTLAAEVADGANIAHLDASGPALMNPSIGTGIRRLPSHTDLFSMASGHAYSNLDVPRREFYGGSDWNTDGNWSGNAIPGAFDEVFIRASGPAGEIRTANLSAAGFASIVLVAEGSNLDTNAFKLDVGNDLTATGLNTDVFVGAGGELEASRVFVEDLAELRPEGGLIDVGTLTNNALVIGQGTIDAQSRFHNNATLTVSGGTLNLVSTGAGVIWNLDGSSGTILFSEPGVVNVTGGDLRVLSGEIEVFNGTMNVGVERRFDSAVPWTLGGNVGTIIFGSDGILNLNGGSTSATAAVVAGALATIIGDVNVGTGDFGRFEADVDFQPNATIVANGTLELVGDATFGGGSYTGAGLIKFDGNQTFVGDTTIAVADLDMDGFTPFGVLSVQSGVTATFNVNTIESDIGGGFDGFIALNGGTLAINTPAPWEHDGQLTINNSGGRGTLDGSQVNVTGGGTVTLNGGNIRSPLALLGGVVETTAADGLLLGAATFSSGSVTVAAAGSLGINNGTLDGASFTGDGILYNNGTLNVLSNTTVAVALFDLDGPGDSTTNVLPGARLTVNVDNLESVTSNDDFNGTLNLDSGSFTVNTLANAWTLAPGGEVNMTNPAGTPGITGEQMQINGGTVTVSGLGRITSAFRATAGGGTLLVNGGGILTVSGQFSSEVDARLTKQGTGTVVFTGSHAHSAGALLSVNSGSVAFVNDPGNGGINLAIALANGHAEFGSRTRLASLNISGPGSVADLLPNGSGLQTLYTRGLSITGLNAELDLNDNDLIFDYPGASPMASIVALLASGYAGGLWTGPGITSDSAAALAEGGPLSTALGVGEASDILGISGVGLGIFGGLGVDATSILVKYTYYGDANLDGMVDVSDLGRLATGWQSSQIWAYGDFNYSGFVDVADLGILATYWQAGVGSPLAPGATFANALAALGLANIPEPSTLSALAVGALALGARRRRD